MKARFTGPLKVRKKLYKEKGWFRKKTKMFWVVEESFSFYDDDDILAYTVPVGFRTDFSSVPWPLTLFYPRDDIDSQAAVGHDWLYHSNKPHSVVKKDQRLSKDRCDQLFLLGMRVCGQPWARRKVKYRAVHFGGWYGWNKKDKAIEEA